MDTFRPSHLTQLEDGYFGSSHGSPLSSRSTSTNWGSRRASSSGNGAGADSPRSGVFNFHRLWELMGEAVVLGRGSFGEVRLCRSRLDGHFAACKIISKARLAATGQSVLGQVLQEVRAMRRLSGSPRVVELLGFFDSLDDLCLVVELCEGGDVSDVLSYLRAAGGTFSETEARHLTRQIFEAVRACHAAGVMHRDVKLENFLISDLTTFTIKASDFGLSACFTPGRPVEGPAVGSVCHMAPEIFSGTYTEKVDVWSAGVCAYRLLSGSQIPFVGQTQEGMIEAIQSAPLAFEGPQWAAVSDEARDFVKTVLSRDPTQRPSAEEALRHPWLAKGAPRSLAQSLASE